MQNSKETVVMDCLGATWGVEIESESSIAICLE